MKILKLTLRTAAHLFGLFLVLAGTAAKVNAEYYTQEPIFNPYPSEKDKKPWNVQNFGPVGIGINITQPGFKMVIANVEKGSPAEKTGKLKKGQVIESINGQVLKDRDPREILGDLISDAEAKDGKIELKLEEDGSVVVEIPVMGAYSPTWPVNCPKSDKIVRQLADLLAKDDKPKWGSVLFLLSTGEDKDLEVVKKWMKGLDTIGGMNWEKSYNGFGLCEYYWRTGDKTMLPVIKKAVDELIENMSDGGWAGRGKISNVTYSVGSGQVHASGTNCLTFLLMAKLCGVEMDEKALKESLAAFYQFSGHGNVAYGDGLPEGGFRDNGKTSCLAMGMQAATLLTPEGEKSIYAKARDNCAMKSFYATNWFHAAHTGGGMGEIWHHMAMGLERESRPVQYRSYLDTRRWLMDLSRRYDGGIGIAGMTDRYDKSASEDSHAWGTFFAMTYTIPRKKLQMFGAPRSPYAVHYQLPERPWGNKADDVYQSNDPIPGSTLTKADLLNETIPEDASLPASRKFNAPDASDELLLRYMHHPDFGIREGAMNSMLKREHYQYIVPLLKESDPRLRNLGLFAINGMFKGNAIPADKMTPEMFSQVEKMVEDPNESWWILQESIHALAKAPPETIAKHSNRLSQLIGHESWYINMAAASTLAEIAAEPKYYKDILPKVVRHLADCKGMQQMRAVTPLTTALKDASPEVKDYAMKLLSDTYKTVPEEVKTPRNVIVTNLGTVLRQKIASLMASLPGGAEFTMRTPKKTLTFIKSGENKDMFVYKEFKPNPAVVGKWLHLCAVSAADDLSKAAAAAHKTIEKAKAKGGTGRNAYKEKHLILKGDGKIDKNSFWSGDKLVVLSADEARKMEVKKIDGTEYLLVEEGDFPDSPEDDWAPKYILYERMK